ncbi:hypothetical protein MKX01_010574 [Papaver californicum]|nr:hypothetical protein MKX01_010574 [Papaver californicum]
MAGGKGARKSLTPSWTQSALLSAHKCGKFRTRAGGPISTSMIWRPKMPTTSSTMVWRPKTPASWEMKYFKEEGLISWERIVRTHSLMKFWEWDDETKRTWEWDASSGVDALEKAKARYWYQLNGFPFESLTTDEYADMNIDTDIDWSPEIDPEISLDLDNRYDINNVNDGSASLDDTPKWLTKEYLYYRDLPVEPPTPEEGWGREFHDKENEQEKEYKNN